ncbi:MAG: hypothetical protein U0V04_08490 [Spirosomataceae bacterium]|jgi:hypothetical protein|nr:hypothetical protein [Bacteroidota bacterium]
MSNIAEGVPAWLKITVFFLILAILALFTDLFTFVVGTLIMIGVFASGYNKEHLHEH